MDPNKNYDSLDKQVNQYYRPRMGFLKQLVTGVTLLATTIFGSGCGPRYDLWAIQSPDSIERKVSDYQDNLKVVAANMGIYDGAANKYDVPKLLKEVENQLKTKDVVHPKTKEKITLYVNAKKYDLEQILATRNSIEEAKKQVQKDKVGLDPAVPAQKTKLDNLNKLYEQLDGIDIDSYESFLKQYHKVKIADKKAKPEDKERHFLALEAGAYCAQDFDKWAELVGKRREECGKLTKGYIYDEPAIWYPDEVRGAHYVREARKAGNRKKFWRSFWSVVVVGSIVAALNNRDDGGSSGGSNIGGEDGGPTGQ